jgi:hypothetical protein
MGKRKAIARKTASGAIIDSRAATPILIESPPLERLEFGARPPCPSCSAAATHLTGEKQFAAYPLDCERADYCAACVSASLRASFALFWPMATACIAAEMALLYTGYFGPTSVVREREFLSCSLRVAFSGCCFR